MYLEPLQNVGGLRGELAGSPPAKPADASQATSAPKKGQNKSVKVYSATGSLLRFGVHAARSVEYGRLQAS
jgi:hypothetical protein